MESSTLSATPQLETEQEELRALAGCGVVADLATWSIAIEFVPGS
jgi:hypothetical protein